MTQVLDGTCFLWFTQCLCYLLLSSSIIKRPERMAFFSVSRHRCQCHVLSACWEHTGFQQWILTWSSDQAIVRVSDLSFKKKVGNVSLRRMFTLNLRFPTIQAYSLWWKVKSSTSLYKSESSLSKRPYSRRIP